MRPFGTKTRNRRHWREVRLIGVDQYGSKDIGGGRQALCLQMEFCIGLTISAWTWACEHEYKWMEGHGASRPSINIIIELHGGFYLLPRYYRKRIIRGGKGKWHLKNDQLMTEIAVVQIRSLSSWQMPHTIPQFQMKWLYPSPKSTYHLVIFADDGNENNVVYRAQNLTYVLLLLLTYGKK